MTANEVKIVKRDNNGLVVLETVKRRRGESNEDFRNYVMSLVIEYRRKNLKASVYVKQC